METTSPTPREGQKSKFPTFIAANTKKAGIITNSP